MHLVKTHYNAPYVVWDTVLHRLKNGKITAAIKVVNAHFFHNLLCFFQLVQWPFLCFKVNAEQNVKTEIERKRDQHLKGVKRKHSAHEESEEFDEDKGDGLQCKHCGRLSPSMFICTQCNTTLYCDEYCQERDWERHQQDCSGDCATNTLADDHQH